MSLMQFIQASAHHMPMLADGSVQMIATSPPYFGLRKYAGEQDIEWPAVDYAPMAGLPALHVPAMRSPLGNEPTLEAYIGHMVLCLREWWRILRDDGIVFLNIADSYANDGKWGGTTGGMHVKGLHGEAVGRMRHSTGLKPKDLMLVPSRLAHAAQADGWYVRSDIIARKLAPMPESVEDRPTRSHEYIWMLTKRANYFCDMDAVREELVTDSNVRNKSQEKQNGALLTPIGKGEREWNNPAGRNLRDVIDWRPQPFASAHFATWPESIPTLLIKMGTSERGCCPACGAAWRRVVERTPAEANGERGTGGTEVARGVNGNADRPLHSGALWYEKSNRVINIGFQPSCTCPAAEPVPCVVLDPFSGSGTTVKAAAKLGRRGIGVDVSAEYLGEVTAARMGDGFQIAMGGIV